MLKLAICEDNDIQCRQIHTLSCSSLEIPVEIDTFSSATDFLNQISAQIVRIQRTASAVAAISRASACRNSGTSAMLFSTDWLTKLQ